MTMVQNHRAPGSIGMGTTGRVLPKKKWQVSGIKLQQKKLKVIQINLEENILVIKDLFQETWKSIKYCSFRIK
jgi:ribosomal protein L3